MVLWVVVHHLPGFRLQETMVHVSAGRARRRRGVETICRPRNVQRRSQGVWVEFTSLGIVFAEIEVYTPASHTDEDIIENDLFYKGPVYDA